MKKNGILLLVSALCLTACGGGGGSKDDKTEIVVKPIDTGISGDLDGCYTIVDRDYKAIGDWGKTITVELERTDEPLPVDVEGKEITGWGLRADDDHVQVQFTLEMLDEDGNVLKKYNSGSDEAVAVAKLRNGKKGTILFSIYSIDEKELKDATHFRISSQMEEKEGYYRSTGSYSSSSHSSDSDVDSSDDDNASSYTSSSHTSPSSVSSTTGSQNWDALLDSYEKYVDKYIAMVRKIRKGDSSADVMMEYASLLEQTQDLCTKLENAKGEMPASQMSRYLRITSKMTQAAATMQ